MVLLCNKVTISFLVLKISLENTRTSDYSYNLCVAHRYPQQGGGVSIGVFHFFFSHCYGWCGLPLHHQMVRQRWQEQQITYWVLCQYKRKEESPDCTAIRFGDSFLCQRGLFISFAYWHYSICRNLLQYAFLLWKNYAYYVITETIEFN